MMKKVRKLIALVLAVCMGSTIAFAEDEIAVDYATLSQSELIALSMEGLTNEERQESLDNMNSADRVTATYNNGFVVIECVKTTQKKTRAAVREYTVWDSVEVWHLNSGSKSTFNLYVDFLESNDGHRVEVKGKNVSQRNFSGYPALKYTNSSFSQESPVESGCAWVEWSFTAMTQSGADAGDFSVLVESAYI